MSFSAKVKEEIFGIFGSRHCRMAELSAIVHIGGNFGDNDLARQKLEMLIQRDLGGKRDFSEIIQNPKSECCKRAYIRGAYLCVGTMAHPKKGYHMEFAAAPDYKAYLMEIFGFFGLAPKEHFRKTGHILYFKEAEQISTILNIMGAHVAMMEFENCRVGKDVNNAINRAANAAAANTDKVIAASVRHIRDIMDIQRLAGLSVLEADLAEVAKIRLDDPFASLEKIGKQLERPISKSGVNHRLKRIAEIAEKYRGGENYVELS